LVFAIPTGVPGVRLPIRKHANVQAGQDIVIGIGPEHGRDGLVPIDIKVELTEPLGADTLVVTRIGEAEIVCRVLPGSKPVAGSPLRIMADASHIHLFDQQSGIALARD
jgi:multiple sugar transport system ATP-binding protein